MSDNLTRCPLCDEMYDEHGPRAAMHLHPEPQSGPPRTAWLASRMPYDVWRLTDAGQAWEGSKRPGASVMAATCARPECQEEIDKLKALLRWAVVRLMPLREDYYDDSAYVAHNAKLREIDAALRGGK